MAVLRPDWLRNPKIPKVVNTLQDRVNAGTAGPKQIARLGRLQGTPAATTPQIPVKNPNAINTLQNRVNAGTAGPKQIARLNTLQGAGSNVAAPVTGGPATGAPSVPRANSKFKLGTTIDELNKQRETLKGKNRLAMVDAEIARLSPASVPPGENPDVLPDFGDKNGIQNPNSPLVNGGDPNALTNTLFPSERIFEPQNYEGSPLYQFQVKEGQKALDRALAAQGLSGSGKHITDAVDLQLRAAAGDTDRMTRVAQENADRLYNVQKDEALRQERAGNAQWDRAYSIAQLLADQNPWNSALAGFNTYADLLGKKGNAKANYAGSNYPRGGGGGGGGGGGAATVPLPNGPDYTNILPYQIGGNYSSNQGWLNLLNQGLSYLW